MNAYCPEEFFSRQELDTLQLSRLTDSVQRAATSEFYARHFAEAGVTPSDIRSCNKGCHDRTAGERYVKCTMNVRTGRETKDRYRIERAKGQKRVLIAGGGPGGMEAARVLTLRGHKVALYEKEGELGGRLRFDKVMRMAVEAE